MRYYVYRQHGTYPVLFTHLYAVSEMQKDVICTAKNYIYIYIYVVSPIRLFYTESVKHKIMNIMYNCNIVLICPIPLFNTESVKHNVM